MRKNWGEKGRKAKEKQGNRWDGRGKGEREVKKESSVLSA